MKVALGAMQDCYGEQLVSRQGEDRMTLRKNSSTWWSIPFNPTKRLKGNLHITVRGGVAL